MKVSILSSGSKGNTTFIETKTSKILIDIGNTSKYVKEKLEGFGVDPASLDAILITHTHVDHVKGLKTFEHKYHIPVYLTRTMSKSLGYLDNCVYIDSDEFDIKDMRINAIKTSHDAADSRGYIISSGGKSIVYITDTGYINEKYFKMLSNHNAYIMESNHDIEMLSCSSYPFNLRQRILSDKGHLSNYDSSKYLSAFIGNKTNYIFLAHLSEENNTEKIAYETLVNKLNDVNKSINTIIVAKQNEETDLITL